MKKSHTIIAAAVMALPTLAFSQSQPATSSLNLYGRFSVNVDHIRLSSEGATPKSHVTTVSDDTSWIGFRGVEDLGGGTRAYFKLEHGFRVDNGNQNEAAKFWNREAYVGLGSASLGSLQIGSQFTPTLWLTGKVDPYRRTGLGAIENLFQALPAPVFSGGSGYVVRADNAVQYITPNMAGLVGRAMVSAGEGSAAGRATFLGLDYTLGRFFIGGSYGQVRSAAPYLPVTGAVGIPKVKSYSLGSTYQFDALKLHGYWQKVDADNGPGSKGGMLGLTVPVGSGEIAGSAVRRTADAIGAGAESKATLLAVQYTQFLSKRTSVYVGAARQKNEGPARYGFWPSDVDGAPSPAIPTVAGQDATGFQIGVLHVF